MANPKLDPEIVAHLEWIGFVRPTGLVVSAPALVRAGAILDRRDTEGQRLLRERVVDWEFDPKEGPVQQLPNFRAFAEAVLGWSFSPAGYAGTVDSPIPPVLEVPLPDYHETLRPDFAVRELDPKEGALPWQLLVRVLDPGSDFDSVVREGGSLEASAQGRMERLLRQTGVPAGLLFNGRALRLVSTPRGESSGWLDFRVAEMVQTAGRPICTALRLLLNESRLLALARGQRLAALLEDSRKFQNEVSERLAQQVLHALYELLRGFQAAHDASRGELLREPLAEHPDEVYRALLTVILRLVFLLYAEERDMLPEDETFLRYYSLAGLYERLREDAALYPDTMDQRFGAWAQLVVLFRMIHDGAESGSMRLPKRHGVLFDPDRFKFLEGRPSGGARQLHERIEPPLVPDGTIYRALEKLLVLDGERISYRALDVEQIGSVYETMMGFRLEAATGRSIAIKPQKNHGAPATVDLEAMLTEPPAKRDMWLQDRSDRKFTDAAKKEVTEARTLEDLHAALLPVIDPAATPDLVPKGGMVLQPSEERRRSGSHYTPRALTEPIVRTSLEPILARLRGADGRAPRAAQILDLKVCDPAMGSGAFLVEACRQLGDALVEAWHAHNEVPPIPADEDEVIFARRLIAQRCLYGVDRNPVAVDLAKVSLWLVTLAKNHPLTFVDHALRHGDSLVGLSRKQIEAFHWDTSVTWESPFRTRMRDQLRLAADLRQRIRDAGEDVADWERRELWDEAQSELRKVRLFGDLVIAAFFEGGKSKDRERKRSEYVNAVVSGDADRYYGWLEERREADPPLAPFHWEIEFPEVFDREHSGFDCFIGNPPFAGIVTLGASSPDNYPEYLQQAYTGTGGKTDLVAYFFRRAFDLLRLGGTAGLIGTKTIGQGDTRESGLMRITQGGGTIYAARRRVNWPGQAAVIVSVVHFIRGEGRASDGTKPEGRISAYLLPGALDCSPIRIIGDKQGVTAGVGNKPRGKGFIASDSGGGYLPTSSLEAALKVDPLSKDVIRPFVGGSDLNQSAVVRPSRSIVDFGNLRMEDATVYKGAFQLLEQSVRPFVQRDNWWQFEHRAKDLLSAIGRRGLQQFLAVAYTSNTLAFTLVDVTWCIGDSIVGFSSDSPSVFCLLQCRVHEVWVRTFASTLKDDVRYVPNDCFDTFPFIKDVETNPMVEAAGKAYYDFRAALMIRKDEGLTKTYNRFHDPDERDSEILKLRKLHAAMDRAVLDAYGWCDIPTACKFILDYEIDEEELGGKKWPYHYRWPDEVRDEVLARLLDLNAERAREEARSGASGAMRQGKKAAAKRLPKPADTGDLFS